MERRPVLGWLPQTILPGSTGLADDCVMGVNLRPVVKRYPQGSKSRIKVAMPEGYSTDVYSWFTPGTEPLKLPSSQLPNGKFDLNLPLYGHDTLSRDLVLAAPHERKWLREECVRFAQGYLYYLQTELGLEDIALAHDEFTANCNLPEQIYIREGRRLQGQVVLNEANINPWLTGDGERPPLQADSVAIGDFELDGKTCRRVVTETGVEQPEGWFFLRGVRAPFQVPFAAMVPKEGSPENLLVPVCLSCTHVAFTAVRMEPVWVQTGQAAGRAAALSLQLNCAPGHLQVSLLQRSLISEGCTLIWFRDIMPETVGFKEIQLAALSGFIPSGSNLKFNLGALLCRSELAHWLVRCLNIPISVSASHYSDVSLSHPHFRAVETLYDLATRNGVLIFGCERVDERPHFFYLHRPDQVPECLSEFEPDATVTCAEFALIVDKLKLCLRAEGLQCPSAIARSEGTSALSRLVFSYWLAQ
ncbi:MAG: FAD-dependent oxidoreductase [Verrucomicrobia bacterium]|nr:FAD-dependent oxidoreductase [Verrucomicrobiota bacterium]